ncbi:hypothetical protein JOE39_003091 [Pseudomonas sp. PvP100]|nr:hypothetical protein [Pseudomonas sp. PvP007]MBP1195112.1 hypothetical protein [Pseudomonas sp. PvP100]
MNTARFVFKSLIKRWMKTIFSRDDNRKRELEPQWTCQGPGSILMERYHHIDASEQDKYGFYDYYYEYDMYYFTEGTLSLVARCYTDDADSRTLWASSLMDMTARLSLTIGLSRW